MFSKALWVGWQAVGDPRAGAVDAGSPPPPAANTDGGHGGSEDVPETVATLRHSPLQGVPKMSELHLGLFTPGSAPRERRFVPMPPPPPPDTAQFIEPPHARQACLHLPVGIHYSRASTGADTWPRSTLSLTGLIHYVQAAGSHEIWFSQKGMPPTSLVLPEHQHIVLPASLHDRVSITATGLTRTSLIVAAATYAPQHLKRWVRGLPQALLKPVSVGYVATQKPNPRPRRLAHRPPISYPALHSHPQCIDVATAQTACPGRPLAGVPVPHSPPPTRLRSPNTRDRPPTVPHHTCTLTGYRGLLHHALLRPRHDRRRASLSAFKTCTHDPLYGCWCNTLSHQCLPASRWRPGTPIGSHRLGLTPHSPRTRLCDPPRWKLQRQLPLGTALPHVPICDLIRPAVGRLGLRRLNPLVEAPTWVSPQGFIGALEHIFLRTHAEDAHTTSVRSASSSPSNYALVVTTRHALPPSRHSTPPNVADMPSLASPFNLNSKPSTKRSGRWCKSPSHMPSRHQPSSRL